MLTLYNMANIFLFSHILLLFYSSKDSSDKLAEYEILEKYRLFSNS